MTLSIPEIQTAYDMKAVVILTCCDIAEKLKAMGDRAGAHAIVTLVKAIEEMPAAGAPK